MFQWYGVYPCGRLRKPCLVAQVQAIVANKILRKFVHRYVSTFILLSDKHGYMLADSQVFQICALGTVFTHTFGKSRVLLVKGTQQGLILCAYALISITYHFSGHTGFTVGKTLIVLCYLRLDVIQREVYHLCLLDLAFARLPFASQSAFGIVCLQLNCAIVPLMVTRPMMGTTLFFSLLAFT